MTATAKSIQPAPLTRSLVHKLGIALVIRWTLDDPNFAAGHAYQDGVIFGLRSALELLTEATGASYDDHYRDAVAQAISYAVKHYGAPYMRAIVAEQAAAFGIDLPDLN